MKTAIFAALALVLGLVAADCHADNCANHVTGTFAGIGVPMSARISLCNDFLRTTVRPPPRTVTTTLTKFVVHSSKPNAATTTSSRSSSSSSSATTFETTDTTLTTITSKSATDSLGANPTIISSFPPFPSSVQATITRSAVPTFAASECPGDGQFASACRCWSRVTPRVSTVPASTVTVTATVSVDVACSPAATAVSNAARFPCSNGFGMCSCLRIGGGGGGGGSSSTDGDGADENGVCVRVGSGFFDDPGSKSDPAGDSGGSAHWDAERGTADSEYDEDSVSPAGWNVTGPCWFARECGVDYGCKGLGNVCVFDDSCLCGKRRCYQAVAGCGGLALPPS